MKTYLNPGKENWKELVKRPQFESEFLDGAVRNILGRIQKSGDQALFELTKQYDKVEINSLQVSEQEFDEAQKAISPGLKRAIEIAAANIEKFHTDQKRAATVIETMPGVTCWRKAIPISKVGIYIPGGSAPLFSTALMLTIPARLAGCKEIILCSPVGASGKINAAILFAARFTGVSKVFKVGGAQAIAAMAYGTESIPQVYKIFGPGNQFVTKAKQLMSNEGVAIDLPAGPSEVLVLADETANPSFVAADLLSQAEHGEDSQVMLVTTNEKVLNHVQTEIQKQIATLPRKAIAERALQSSRGIYFNSLDSAIDFSNEYAPEHLIINSTQADEVAEKIVNAGSVFIGNYSPEAVGDYASGTNHTLPTNGYAKAFAGVSLESFTKQITFQKLTEQGIQNIGPSVEMMAEAEGLEAHKRAVRIRLNSIQKS
ncbi:MAG TPA: histidinol dehydrogenase [Cyclobacteriaceae bacterium]|nr:histidinol dehydrogenase [Cyclobacteriaceae bacterium]